MIVVYADRAAIARQRSLCRVLHIGADGKLGRGVAKRLTVETLHLAVTDEIVCECAQKRRADVPVTISEDVHGGGSGGGAF